MKISLGQHDIDLDKLIDTKLLIQANSGGGKSWAIRRILEQSHGHVQQIVIDFEGEFSSLREKYDYILAGKEGDTPADPKTAALLARRLLELNVSAIIDIYELKQHERIFFVKNFLDSMMNVPRGPMWHPCLVIVDEAHIFCPEKGQSEAAGAVIDLATRGRKRGYCAVLATQRISSISKNAIAQCNNKMIGRTGLDVDMKRASEELGFTSKDQYMSLRRLEPGEFFAFGPAISKEVIRTTVGMVKTTHPSAGHRIAKKKATPPPAKIRAVLKKLSDLPAEARQEAKTVADLQSTIRSLRHELRIKKPVDKIVDNKNRKLVNQLTIENSRLSKMNDFLDRKNKDAIVILYNYEKHILKIIDGLKSFKALKLPYHHKDIHPKPTVSKEMVRLSKSLVSAPLPSFPTKPTSQIQNEDTNEDQKPLGIGEKKILGAIAQQDDGMTREHITVVTGYKRSSRDTYLQRLMARGLVSSNAAGTILATQEGIDYLGDDFERLPIGSELQSHVLAKLPIGEKKILEILIGAYPDSVERDLISEQTGYQRSSRDTYLQRLSARQLIATDRGSATASDKLFD